MSSSYDYKFYNLDRTGDDSTLQTQDTLQNTRYANYTTTNFFSEFPSDTQIQFATAQPIVVPNSTFLGGGAGTNVDTDSKLKLSVEQERYLGRLSLIERPFVTVPYLGRGSVSPNVESQLLQGELITDKKSVTTIMSKSFLDYKLPPNTPELQETVQENVINGWTRGGKDTRAPAGYGQ